MYKIFVLAIVFLLPLQVLAAEGIGAAGQKLNTMREQGITLSGSLQGTTAGVVTAIFYVVGTIFLGLMIYGGIVWAKSAGREEEVKRAKRIVIATIIGLVVVMASYGITNFILNRITMGEEATKTCEDAGGVCMASCPEDTQALPGTCSDTTKPACCNY